MIFFSGKPFRYRAAHEALALLGHLLQLLFAHRAAQQIGIAQRVARQQVRDLHHLLLVQDDAVGFLQQLLQLGHFVCHRLAPVLTIDEVGGIMPP